MCRRVGFGTRAVVMGPRGVVGSDVRGRSEDCGMRCWSVYREAQRIYSVCSSQRRYCEVCRNDSSCQRSNKSQESGSLSKSSAPVKEWVELGLNRLFDSQLHNLVPTILLLLAPGRSALLHCRLTWHRSARRFLSITMSPLSRIKQWLLCDNGRTVGVLVD